MRKADEKPKKIFAISEIVALQDGRDSKNFKRFGRSGMLQQKMSFSLILKKRTIDLQAINYSDKEDFFEIIRQLLEKL